MQMFNRALVLVLFLLPFFSPSAQAQAVGPIWPVLPLCMTGGSYDSYGMGLRSGFRGMEVRTEADERWIHLPCYQEGQRKGAELARSPETACARGWEEGFVRGFAATPYSDGRPCWSEAYTAGLAHLRVGARRGDVELVGERCMEFYRRGLQDGAASQGMTPEGTPAARACYDAGFWDASVPQSSNDRVR